jgi:hypothetical protein
MRRLRFEPAAAKKKKGAECNGPQRRPAAIPGRPISGTSRCTPTSPLPTAVASIRPGLSIRTTDLPNPIASADRNRQSQGESVCPREPGRSPALGPTEALLRSTCRSGRPRNHLVQQGGCFYPGGQGSAGFPQIQHAAEFDNSVSWLHSRSEKRGCPYQSSPPLSILSFHFFHWPAVKRPTL